MKFTSFIKTSIPVSTLSKYNLSDLFPTKDVVLDKELYAKEQELKSKSEILNYEPNEHRFYNNFLDDTKRMIVKELSSRGLDTRYADRMLAQIALESNFGKSESGKNNYSGIKGSGSKRNTKEYFDGKYLNVVSEFKDYETREEWIKDYIDLLSNSRYGHAFNLPEDQFIPYIHKQGYATDPEYVSKVDKIYNLITSMEEGGEIDSDDNKIYKKYVSKWNDTAPYGSEELFLDFILKHEDFSSNAYIDKKNGKYTVGYGNTYLYDKDGNITRRVSSTDKLSKELALQQVQYHLNADLKRIKDRFPNFDLFEDGVKYALREGVYNIGETELFNKNGKFYKALKKYHDSNDYKNLDLIKDMMIHFDWNRDTRGNIGLRSGRRRAMMQGVYDWNDNENINKFTGNNYNKSAYWQWGKDINKFLVRGNRLK